MMGLFLSNKTKNREKYFADLLNLVDRLISDISYLQDPAIKIISSFETKSIHFKKNIDEYLEFTNGGKFNFSNTILNKREAGIINDFFNRLGTLDYETQINELNSKKMLFIQMYDGANKKNKNFGKAFIKLGFLGGLLVGIMIL
ncbi:MAG: stage III sporulation protein AB [Firmicutes bacterium]|nr:stage III sporulation protein AB [Bacillota bacterium]